MDLTHSCNTVYFSPHSCFLWLVCFFLFWRQWEWAQYQQADWNSHLESWSIRKTLWRLSVDNLNIWKQKVHNKDLKCIRLMCKKKIILALSLPISILPPEACCHATEMLSIRTFLIIDFFHLLTCRTFFSHLKLQLLIILILEKWMH